jgi:DNA-binding SARP family transcriptional activator
MSQLQISLFGKFCVHCNGQLLAGLDSLKVQELFSYLLLYRQRPHVREKLATLLWLDSSASQAKRYLRQALWQLQSEVDDGDPASTKMTLVESEWIQVNRLADFHLDVALFEQAFTAVQGKSGTDLDQTAVARLRDAIQLYRGDLLESWYHDWCILERERLQSMYLAILDKLMEHCEFHQEYEMGAVYASQILQHDAAREQTYRRLMRLRYLAGDRTGALRYFQRCAKVLHQELGVKPSKRTEQLYQQIEADQPLESKPALPAVQRPLPPLSPPSLPDILNRLRQLKHTLRDAEEQVEQEIRTVKSWLNRQSR